MADRASKIMKAIAGGIKGYADVIGERQKIQADMVINEMKASQNWVYKLKELQTPKALNPMEEEQLTQQKMYRGMFEKQNQPAPSDGEFLGSPPVAAGISNMEVRAGKEGFEPHYFTQDELNNRSLSAINVKRQRNISLTPDELTKERELKKGIVNEAMDYQKKLAGMGYQIQMDPKLSPEKNLERTRNAYARIMDRDIKKGQPVTDASAKIIGYRPKGSVFAPRGDNGSFEDEISQMVRDGTTNNPPSAKEYTPQEETLIQDNMNAYGKSREEIIEALTSKGYLE